MPQQARIGAGGERASVHVYDRSGVRVRTVAVSGVSTVLLPAGGFAVAQG